MNEKQVAFECQCYEALSTLWLEPHEVTSKIWPSMSVMKAHLATYFQHWHEDNPMDELKPGYQEIDVDRWQVKEVMDKQPQWHFQFIVRWQMIKEYKEAPRALHIDPSFCRVPRRYTWD